MTTKSVYFWDKTWFNGNMMNWPILWVHSPTSWGWLEVHADGRTVSSALVKPSMTLKAEILAVIEPRLRAASAVVEIWPIETTDTVAKEYSRRWDLWIFVDGLIFHEKGWAYPNTGKAYLVKIASSSWNIVSFEALSAKVSPSLFSSIRGTGRLLRRGLVSVGEWVKCCDVSSCGSTRRYTPIVGLRDLYWHFAGKLSGRGICELFSGWASSVLDSWFVLGQEIG